MSRTRLQWAQWMAARGISVFICEPGSKNPLAGHSWYLRQTTDPDDVAHWFAETPNCNYGVHLGEQYVVIDLDKKPGADGVTAFEELCREHDIDDFLLEIDTLVARTPGGGYHLYFRAPFPCANRNSFPDGIDVRGVVGYVVGPGSTDSRGTWELIDPDAEIAELPGFLAEYLSEPGYKDPLNDVPVTELDQQENIDHATEWLQKREPALEGHNGDDWTYETIQFLRDYGLSEEQILLTLNESGWNARCEPPWGDAELEAKIKNAWTYGQNRPGSKAPTYKVERLTSARPEEGWAHSLTDEQLDELFNPESLLSKDWLPEADSDEDDDIPQDVVDDESYFALDDAGDIERPSIWHDVLDFAQIKKVREYVIYNWLIAHGITHLIAKRGTGKTTVALDMAFHIACDMDWCNIPTQKGWKVIYICGEDDEGLILNTRAWMQDHGVEPDRGRFRVADDIIRLSDEAKLRKYIREMVEWADGVPCVVVLDTWQRATSGWSKNDQQEMEKAVERAEIMAHHLKGPMLSCVHPPKDGRMTVVGSGVQEDTSTALLSLEKVGEGVRLRVDRMKGPGEGKYVTFQLDITELEGTDSFGRPLTGLVAHKIGGSEDADKLDEMTRRDRELTAWADAIRGIESFSRQNNTFEPVKSLNIKNVTAFILEVYELTDGGHSNDQVKLEDAREFRTRYLEGLDRCLVNNSQSTISKKLSELFYGGNGAPPVAITSDGLFSMSFMEKAGSRPNPNAKKRQRVFVFEARNAPKEEED